MKRTKSLARVALTLLLTVITSIEAWGFTYSASDGTTGANSNEGYAKLVDGNKSTKWCVTSLGSPTFIEFSTSEAIIPQGYVLTTGNDTGSSPGRNPKSWVIKAKANSGDSWTTIATVTNDTRMPAANTTDCAFPINNTNAYQYFRFEISAVQNGSVFQLAEFEFLTNVNSYDFTTANVDGLKEFYYYTGSAITLDYSVTDFFGNALTEGTDYSAIMTRNGSTVTEAKERGNYTLTFAGMGSYSGSQTFNFTIGDYIEVTSSTTKMTTCTYKVTSDVTISSRIEISGTVNLVLGEGATLTASNGIEVPASATLIIDGPGSLIAQASSNDGEGNGRSGIGASVSYGNITINGGNVTAKGYNGGAGIGGNRHGSGGGDIIINGGVVNATGSTTTLSNTSYYSAGIGGGASNWGGNIYGYFKNVIINGGQVTADVIGNSKGRNHGTLVMGWTNPTDFIQADTYSAATMSFAEGKEFLLDGTTTVATTSNINGKKIVPNVYDFANVTISNISDSYEYTGSAIAINYSLSYNSTTLVEGTDYEVTIVRDGIAVQEVKETGSYTLTFTGKGHYAGSKTASFTVEPPVYDFADVTISNIADTYDYSGSAIAINYILSYNNTILVEGTDYEVTIVKDGVAVQEVKETGSYTLTFTGKGYYVGSKTASFTVETPPNSYEIPTGLTCTKTTATTATLSWTENGTATQWEICLNGDTINLVTATTSPFRLTHLTKDATYTAKVRAAGDGGEHGDWSDSISFVASDKRYLGTGTATGDNTVPIYSYSKHAISEQIYTKDELGPAGFIQSIDFFSTNYFLNLTRNLDIYLAHTTKSKFANRSDWATITASDLVFSGEVDFEKDAWTTIDLQTPFAYNGENNVVLVVDDNTGSTRSDYSTFYVYDAPAMALYTYKYYPWEDADIDPTNVDTLGHIVNYKNRLRLDISTSTNFIPKPTNVVVSNVHGNTAQVSWISTGASSWEICLNDDEDNIITATTNPFTINAPYLGTNYEVKVRGVNGNDISSWSNPVTFHTDACMPEYQCTLSYELSDIYDGDMEWWGGDAIRVVDVTKNLVLATLSRSEDESDIGSLNVCAGDTIRFEWVSGYASENCKYTFYDGNGDEIFTRVGALTDTIEYVVDCTITPLKKPTKLTVAEVGSAKVQLNWKEMGSARKWVVAYKSEANANFIEVIANTRDFTLTGLAYTTSYTVKVCATDGTDRGKWSEPTSFTTLEYNPAPWNVTVAPNGTTAAVNWKGDSETYTVRYRKAAYTVTSYFEGFNDKNSTLPQDWTNIDVGSTGGGWYTSSPYPEDRIDYDGNPRIFDEGYVRSDTYNEDPDSWLVSPRLDLQGMMSVWIRPYDSGENEHFAIYLSTKETITSVSDFTITLVPETVVGDKFIEYCADLSSYNGQKGYIAIRHFNSTGRYSFIIVDNFSILTIPTNTVVEEWATITTTDKSIELTNLEMDARYELQVKGTTGNDQSAWSNITPFTAHIPTPSYMVLPMCQSAYVLISSDNDNYEISYRPSSTSGEEGWTSVSTTNKTYRVTGLTSDTDYDIRVRNIVGENASDWVSQTFITASGPVRGDVNGDDQISVSDITAMVNVMNGNTSGYNVQGADLNRDSVVDQKDIKYLIQMLFYLFE